MSVPSLIELCFVAAAKQLETDHDSIVNLPEEVVERLLAWMVNRLHPNHSFQLNQSLAVKVLTQQNHVLMFRFLVNSTVGQAMDQVVTRLSDRFDPHTFEDHGMFQRTSAPHGCNQWLDPNLPISAYNIKSGDTLEFRSTKAMLQIEFQGHWEKVIHPLHIPTLEATSKAFLIDESLSVAAIAEDIGRKLGLPFPQEFGFKLLKDDTASWLKPDQTLAEQGIDPLYSKFLFCKMYSFHPWEEAVDASTDYSRLHLIFCQCVDAIVNVVHPCPYQEAIYLAALQCQSTYGDYGVMSFNGIDIKIRDYLPPEYLSIKNIKESIFEIYQKLKGMSEVKAKTEYVRLARSLKSYGFTCFAVERPKLSTAARDQPHKLYFGVSNESVILLDAATKDLLSREDLGSVSKWQVLHSYISLFMDDCHEELLTSEAETISEVLNGYITFALRHHPDRQRRWSKQYDQVGREYRRSRTGSEVDLLREAVPKDESESKILYYQCPLYVEPKKIYTSPLYGKQPNGPLRRISSNSHIGDYPNASDTQKARKLMKMIKAIAGLSQKMTKKATTGEQEELTSINVRCANKSDRKFDVHPSKKVVEIALELGHHLGIRNPEEFSLQIEENQWLDPYLPLNEQGVSLSATLFYYKRKFFYNDEGDDFTTDPIYYNLLFYQSRDEIISNTHSTDMEQAAQLAGTLFQINFGDWNENIHKPGFLRQEELKFFLPPASLELWGVSFSSVERLIYAEHRKLVGMTRAHAKFRYILLCRQLKTYGTMFFPVKRVGKKLKPHPLVPYSSLMLGFNRDSILVMDQRTKKVILECLLTRLYGWTYDQQSHLFTLLFGNYEEKKFSFYTTEGESISRYLSDYNDFVQSKIMGRLWPNR